MDMEIFKDTVDCDSGIEKQEEYAEDVQKFAEGIAIAMGMCTEEFFDLPDEVRKLIYSAFFAGCEYQKSQK